MWTKDHSLRPSEVNTNAVIGFNKKEILESTSNIDELLRSGFMDQLQKYKGLLIVSLLYRLRTNQLLYALYHDGYKNSVGSISEVRLITRLNFGEIGLSEPGPC